MISPMTLPVQKIKAKTAGVGIYDYTITNRRITVDLVQNGVKRVVRNAVVQASI